MSHSVSSLLAFQVPTSISPPVDYDNDVQWLGREENTWIPITEEEERCVAGIIKLMGESKDTTVWRNQEEKAHLTEFFTWLFYRDTLRLATEKRLLTRYRLTTFLMDPQTPIS